MSEKICPKCNEPFARRKKGCCPNCDEELYFPTGRFKGVLTMKEKKAADALVDALCELIGDRDGVEMSTLNGGFFNAERSFIYDMIIRARNFLAKQATDLGYSAGRFVIDLVEWILNIPWWHQHLKSYLMLKNKISELAVQFYKEKRDNLEREQSQSITFVDYGTSYAYCPGIR